MDCEKFDRVVLDQLYGELDELTSAAAKRHTEHCMRCRRIETGLRATREVGMLPDAEPPPELYDRILSGERAAHAVLPVRQRVAQAVSLLAAYAMRPQLAMAALLVLMVGGSLLLLRARPDEVATAERGAPELEPDPAGAPLAPPEKAAAPELDEESQLTVQQPRPEAKKRAARADEAAGRPATEPTEADADPAYDAAMAAYNARRYSEAERRFDELAESGGPRAASAALFAAESARHDAGCGAATSRYERVTDRFPGTSAGNEAAWRASECYRALGDIYSARRHLQALLSTQFATRAQDVLDDIERTEKVAGRRAAKRAGSAAANEAAPAAAPPPRPAATSEEP